MPYALRLTPYALCLMPYALRLTPGRLVAPHAAGAADCIDLVKHHQVEVLCICHRRPALVLGLEGWREELP